MPRQSPIGQKIMEFITLRLKEPTALSIIK